MSNECSCSNRTLFFLRSLMFAGHGGRGVHPPPSAPSALHPTLLTDSWRGGGGPQRDDVSGVGMSGPMQPPGLRAVALQQRTGHGLGPISCSPQLRCRPRTGHITASLQWPPSQTTALSRRAPKHRRARTSAAKRAAAYDQMDIG